MSQSQNLGVTHKLPSKTIRKCNLIAIPFKKIAQLHNLNLVDRVTDNIPATRTCLEKSRS